MYYLNTDTIKKAYEELTKVEYKEPSIIFSYILIRACGINRVTYESPNFAQKNCLYYASRLSSLFSPVEQQPKSYGFINPFAMKSWSGQPSESLKQWSGARLKNNVLGGAMTWRGIIDIDSNSDDRLIKFKYDYVKIIKNLAFDINTINLFALAVWSNRFTEFEKKITAKELCDEFRSTYKINVDEMNAFYNTKQQFELDFADKRHNSKEIRDLIGTAPDNSWASIEFSNRYYNDYILEKYQFDIDIRKDQEVNEEILCSILEDYKQVILSGPPGTSKSYYANKIGEKYDEVVHVQFHPQYSYQNFIGGYFVEGDKVIFRKGVILNLIDEQKYSPEKKYLLIIDEFNRANVSQVLGEVVQCLDRNTTVSVEVNGEPRIISLPGNIHILATLNSTDRTLGTIDYAVKRRFMSVYCPPNPNLLIDLCPSSNFISLCDFLNKLNRNLYKTLRNRELAVGHAIFLNNKVKRDDGKFIWTFESLRILFNYKILPLVQDYCSNNQELIEDVLGKELASPLKMEDFKEAIFQFMEIKE